MAKIIRNQCPECENLKDERAKVCRQCLFKLSNLDVVSEKKCSKCKEILPINNFRLRLRFNKIRPRSWCKKCEMIDCNTRHRKNNPPKIKLTLEEREMNKVKSLIRTRLKEKNINLSKEEIEIYINNYLNQSKCPICLRDVKDLHKLLSIDHCHSTGKIRGFLCSNCNAGIGMLNDDPGIVRKALDYLLSFN